MDIIKYFIVNYGSAKIVYDLCYLKKKNNILVYSVRASNENMMILIIDFHP